MEVLLFLLFHEGFLEYFQVPELGHVVHMNMQMLFHHAQAGHHDFQLLPQHPLPTFGLVILPPPLLLCLQPPLLICPTCRLVPALLQLHLKFQQFQLHGAHPNAVTPAFLPLLLPLEPLQLLPQFPSPASPSPGLRPLTGSPEQPLQTLHVAP